MWWAKREQSSCGDIPSESPSPVSLSDLISNYSPLVIRTHPFAQLSGTDNIISFTTKRYNKQPLVVRGPGAGPEVTAGGVFGDLLKLAAYLGAPS